MNPFDLYDPLSRRAVRDLKEYYRIMAFLWILQTVCRLASKGYCIAQAFWRRLW